MILVFHKEVKAKSLNNKNYFKFFIKSNIVSSYRERALLT